MSTPAPPSAAEHIVRWQRLARARIEALEAENARLRAELVRRDELGRTADRAFGVAP